VSENKAASAHHKHAQKATSTNAAAGAAGAAAALGRHPAEKEALVEPDRASRDGICVVAAAPSLTPWSVLRESAADEGEEEYDFYGYDETYYPRPPWVWPRGIEWLHQCSGMSAALQARGSLQTRLRASWA
jgi:hypothetical protein